MLKIGEYFTNAPSGGIITMLEKPEAIDALITAFFTAFGTNWATNKLEVKMSHLHEELALYKPYHTIENIKRVLVWYDGHQIDIQRLMQDTEKQRLAITYNIYNPVIGCGNDCAYCFTHKVNDQFQLVPDWHKPVFRGMYGFTKDENGDDIPELFMKRPKNGKPIGWMLTYYSDFGCWKSEWQKNVFEQIIAAVNLRKKRGEHPDTFTLLTKRPDGIDLNFIPEGTELREVCFGVTVDRNAVNSRIKTMIDRLKHIKASVMISYQPLLEHIEPQYLEELAEAFGKQNCYVLIGGELAEDNSPKPTPFEWMKDIIDKCIELGIPYAMHFTLKNTVEAAGYEYIPQKTSAERYDEAMNAEYYDMRIGSLNRRLKKCPVSDRLNIAAFIMLGDVEVTVESAKRLLNKCPDFDLILTAETKGIPLAHEMARQSGKRYITARKSVKVYMTDCIEVSVKSITTAKQQNLYLDKSDAEAMKGKRILIVDDVISTGESLKALEVLVSEAGGIPAAKAAVLAEGDAAKRDDIIFLEPLPVFPHDDSDKT